MGIWDLFDFFCYAIGIPLPIGISSLGSGVGFLLRIIDINVLQRSFGH